MPTRQRSGLVPLTQSGAPAQCQPGAHGQFGVVLVRLGIPETDEHRSADTFGDKTLECADDGREAILIGGDRVAHIHEVAAGPDQFARHDRQLPTRRSPADKSVAAARQRLDPALATGPLAERPSQRRCTVRLLSSTLRPATPR
jgi:hypothetical protein